MKKRSKKRNLLTTNAELAELAYAFHISAQRLRLTASKVNIPQAYRLQIAARIQWLLDQARSLGSELNSKDSKAFATKESTERIAEQLGVFD